MDRTHEKVLQLRTLAARLRGYAAETSLEIFRDKFHAMADDLEEEARRAENPAHLQAPLSVRGHQRGYRH
jgi:hypothetical protein